MKNSVESNNYVLFSKELRCIFKSIGNYQYKVYNFKNSYESYYGNQLAYLLSVIDNDNLKLKPSATTRKVVFNKTSSLVF